MSEPVASAVSYAEFLASKAPRAEARGLSRIPPLSSHLFGFQRHCVEFHLGIGSGLLALDTGLGKGLIELEYSEHARQASNGWALILTPLAVAKQIEREARKFGYDARVIRDQSEAREGINICNYDRLHLLDPRAFGCAALDEASILKSFGGKTSRLLIETFSTHRWRLPATATPAPNDHMELGTYAEFCGVMQSNEMLSRFFINDTSQASQKWRLKHYGVDAFWDWMASWCRLAQLPSDLGGDDTGFILPPIRVERHRPAESAPTLTGGLFGDESVSATNMAALKRRTIDARVAIVLAILEQDFYSGSVAWQSEKIEITELQNKLNSGKPSDGSNTLIQAPNINRDAWKIGEATETPLTGNSSEPINTYATNSVSNSKTIAQCSTSKMDAAPYVGREIQKETENSTSIIATRLEKSEACSVTDATLPSASSEKTPKILIGRSITSKILTRESWVLWCDLNSEQESIERALTARFGKESFFSIKGSDSTENKEDWIYRWCQGERPILVTKPSVCGYGLNFQHCNRTIFVGRNFSYESYYQAVRRFWRFGQTREVQVHLVVAEGEDSIGRVIDRKAEDHVSMKTAMRAAMQRNSGRESATKVAYMPSHRGVLPAWIA